MLRAGSRWVLWLLIGLSLAALTVMLERLWFFVQERRPQARLAAAMAALRRTARPPRSPSSRACVRWRPRSRARASSTPAAGPTPSTSVRAAVVEQERARYEKRLAFLGTLGNNAPFVGLFGTVLGIIRVVSRSVGRLDAEHAARDGRHRRGAGRDRRRAASSRCRRSPRTTRACATSRPRVGASDANAHEILRVPQDGARGRVMASSARRRGAASSRRSTSRRSSTSCSCC